MPTVPLLCNGPVRDLEQHHYCWLYDDDDVVVVVVVAIAVAVAVAGAKAATWFNFAHWDLSCFFIVWCRRRSTYQLGCSMVALASRENVLVEPRYFWYTLVLFSVVV
jgi:hypothetical protein